MSMTPTTEEAKTKGQARFGHHPDPSTDFCIEIDALQGWAIDMRAGLRSQWPYWARLSALLEFTRSPDATGLDAIAQAALPRVFDLEGTALSALAAPRADSAERTAGEASYGDGRRICEALGFDPANHHNALKCPYCNPNGLALSPAPSSPGVPDSVRAPDDLTREQIRGRAKALLVKNGWKPGDNFAAQNVIELMATIGMSLLTDPPQDRCAHPECGCDADSVCSTALSAHPAGQSTGQGAGLECTGCGSRESIEGIRARGFMSCCPERKMEPAPASTRTGQVEAVAVPASALRWLFGEGPDEDGVWFGDQIRGKGAFWWRSEFRRRIEAARPTAPEAQGTWVKVDVPVMRLSDGRADYYVRITCGDREVTPYKFADRYKAEYEAAHFAWVFGLRDEKPDLMAYDEASHPNEAPASSGQESA